MIPECRAEGLLAEGQLTSLAVIDCFLDCCLFSGLTVEEQIRVPPSIGFWGMYQRW